MRSVVIHGTDRSSIEDVPRPEPAGEDVLVAVDRVQLSVTECRLYRGHDIAHRDAVDRQLRGGSARPFGHEFCDTVVDVGPDVTRFEQGDRVYPPGKIPCEECGYCRSGYRQYCSDRTRIGYDRPGGLSEYVLQPETALAAHPDAVSDADGRGDATTCERSAPRRGRRRRGRGRRRPRTPAPRGRGGRPTSRRRWRGARRRGGSAPPPRRVPPRVVSLAIPPSAAPAGDRERRRARRSSPSRGSRPRSRRRRGGPGRPP